MGYYSIDLESTRTNQTSISRKVPFEHQIDAFEALTKNFIFEKPKGIGGLLVLQPVVAKPLPLLNGFAIMLFRKT